MAYESLKSALTHFKNERYFLRTQMRPKYREIHENKLSAHNALIDFVEEQLAILEARGNPQVTTRASCLGNEIVLSAEQAADIARAEQECVRLLEWHDRRCVQAGAPPVMSAQRTKGVHAIRNCLDILRKMPVAAPRSPGQKAWEVAKASHSMLYGIGGPSWDGLSSEIKMAWEEIAGAASK